MALTFKYSNAGLGFMTHLNPSKVGLALGAMFAVLHAVWSAAVALVPGPLQKFLDWVFALHHLKPMYSLLPFNLMNAVILVILTFVVGYVVGFVFATIWNKVAK